MMTPNQRNNQYYNTSNANRYNYYNRQGYPQNGQYNVQQKNWNNQNYKYNPKQINQSYQYNNQRYNNQNYQRNYYNQSSTNRGTQNNSQYYGQQQYNYQQPVQGNQPPQHHMIQEGLDLKALSPHKKSGQSWLNNGSPLARIINNFLQRNTSFGAHSAAYKKYNSQDFKYSTIDHLMYKGLTHDDPVTHYLDHGRHYLILANDSYQTTGYAEMIRVGGTSLSDLPTPLILGRMNDFINFFHAYRSELNFISLPLPNDSRTQRHAWDKQLNKIRLKLLNPKLPNHQRAQLLSMQSVVNENLSKLRRIDTNLINQGFVMMIFQAGAPGFDTIRKLDVSVRTAYHFGRDVLNLSPMDARQKEIFLFHLNNPNNERTN